ncbi:MAG: site-specific integrase [Desulfuromonas thiophila]|nr:site-specific integrase [Desulfuromonas thiophila]
MARGKNSKGVYLRGKTWWITYSGPDGRQYFESSGSKLKADAEYQLACRRKAIAEGETPQQDRRQLARYTVAELCDQYDSFVAGRPGYATKKLFVAEIKAALGQFKLAQLSLAAVETWQNRLLTEPRPNRSNGRLDAPPLSVASVNRRLACLKHMATKGYDWEMLTKDTLDRLRRVKLAKENNARLRFLSVEESERLVACADAEVRPVLVCALNTGCRKEEILSLTWDQVDMKHGFIRLNKTKNGEKRDVPINATLAACLRSLPRSIDPAGYVFTNPATGRRWSDLKRGFDRACQRAKLTDLRIHDLRHTFASQLVMAGVDLTTVSRLLGHKTLTMTLRYSHLAPDHLQSAVSVLDRLTSPAVAFGADR